MKKTIRIILLFILSCITIAVPVFAINGSYGEVDIANGWGYDYRHTPYSWPQCTWYAWGRTYEKLGIELNWVDHARYWADRAASAGYRVDDTPSADSIFVENWYNGNTPDPYGHVMYIEKVENAIDNIVTGWCGKINLCEQIIDYEENIK